MTQPQTMTAGSDPADYTVDQVNAYLATADEAERERVLAAEAAGKARSTVKAPTADDDAPAPDTQSEDDRLQAGSLQAVTNAPGLMPRAGTGDLAADPGDPRDLGYTGTSPARAFAGGAEDKGLSQRNADVMRPPTGGDQPSPHGTADDSQADPA